MAKKAAPKKGKGTPKPKKAKKGLYTLYKVQGEKLVRESPWSPKLGAGYFMAVHKNRKTCGQTHYTEFVTKEEKKD